MFGALLTAPDFSKPFWLVVDSTDVGEGISLMRKILNIPFVISLKNNVNQNNYPTKEKECLALILATMQHFDIYVMVESPIW